MKKLIAITLTLLLILTLIVPASAATTMHWDWGKAQASVNNAATDLIREEQSTETEYVVVEEPDSVIDTEDSVTEHEENVIEPAQERHQSWRGWLRRWSWCLEGWK